MDNKTLTQQFAELKFQPQEHWMVDNLILESIMGSHAYGCHNEDSDFDIVGVVMDKHEQLYPQAYGYILGFDNVPKFENKESKGEHNRLVLKHGSKEQVYEAAWHSLTNFFHLVGNGSPNLTEVLFVKRALVTYGHEIGWLLRDNRRTFLSMRMYQSFKGYAISQFVRIKKEAFRWKTDHKCDNSNRMPLYEKYGYDVKMSYHTLRLIDLLHQLMTEGDLDLMRNKEECKAMRSGDWGDFDKFSRTVDERMEKLEKLSLEACAVPNKPQHEPLKQLLAKCIEMWYGSESQMQRQGTEYVSVKMLMERLDRMEQKIDQIPKVSTVWKSESGK